MDIKDPQEGVKYPVCLDGRRACPPEDCGGPWGYSDILDVLRIKKSKSREELFDWLGYEFDPEEFTVVEVNGQLR
mgnify:CR=1 FL=1